MNMTPRNIALFAAAILVGLLASQAFPIVGLLLVIPAVGYVIYVLVNNKGGAEASAEETALARQFTAAPGMAAIYVMRHGFVGGQQGMNVTINGLLTSQFRTKRFVRAEVPPGSHTVRAQMAAQTKGTAVEQVVDLAAGECVLLDAKLDMGALQGKLVLLETRDPTQARAKLAPLKLVQWQG